MNKDIEEKAKSLNKWILDQDIVKEYKHYEKLIKSNTFLTELETELKEMQKKIVVSKHHGRDCQQLIEKYHKKKKIFDENPLVCNYLVYKQEVNALLLKIQDDINQQLKKMVD